MELKYTESFAENMRELGFKIKYYMGTPAAYYDGMAIEFEEDYYGSPILKVSVTDINYMATLHKFRKAFEFASSFIMQNRETPKSKIKHLFDHNKISLGNILETNSGVYIVGHISTTVPKLTITSINSGDVVAMGQSLSELGNNFCDYFAKHRKGIPMVTIWNSFNEYLDQH